MWWKTDEVDGIQTRVAELVPLDLDMEQEGVAQGFTRILIKDRRDDDAGRRRQQQQQQQQQQEQQGRFGSTSIEQRQAEYERTRAEIFQEEHKPGITSNESTYPDAINAQERMP
ncbi:hypothetical protein GGF39_003144 [Coemansia sp. RSA 1721]|nr:hypothetical protein GGF39_003144 [Coemansia sp. RSA 1721]